MLFISLVHYFAKKVLLHAPKVWIDLTMLNFSNLSYVDERTGTS